jgi:TetR/AcrR family transcriptional regulator, copper-responsive repressor
LFKVVQNEASAAKRRGRPRAYDPEAALARATERFWQGGYAGTSLDEICAATGMNRPSLYAAFGDKHRLYLRSLEGYWEVSLRAMQDALTDRQLPVRDALIATYEGQLAIYFGENGQPRGCFVVGTAVTEALNDPAIQTSLAEGLRALDKDFETRLRQAQDRGELAPDVDPAARAIIATGVLHTIAIRARAGVRRPELQEIARKAVEAICA